MTLMKKKKCNGLEKKNLFIYTPAMTYIDQTVMLASPNKRKKQMRQE